MLQSQQVDRSELDKGLGQIEFQNYTGPTAPAQVNTRSQIWNIGYPLGAAIRGGAQRNGGTNRYFVIHSVTPPEGNKLDADIFGLGPGVGVDHIRNLRLIIQGYLEGAYNYSAQDAALLAEYITIYNAVFRENWNYFTNTYKTAVVQQLTPERAGLSTRFSDWPGRTLILIPLNNATAGSASAVDTSALSGSQVVEEMRRSDEDEGAARRTAMADLKDREAEEAEEAARRLREAIAAEEARIAAERAALDAERERLARERARLSAEEAAARQAELDRKAKELADREAALARDREAAQGAEDFADQKRSEAQSDRQDITGTDGDGSDGSGDGSDGSGDGSDGSGDGSDGSGDGSDGSGDGSDGSGDGSDGSGDGKDGAGSQAGQDGSDDASDSEDDGAKDESEDGEDSGEDSEESGDDPDKSDNASQTGKDASSDSGDGEDEEGGFVVRQDGVPMGVVGMVIAARNAPYGYIVRVNSETGEEFQRSAFNTVNIRTVIFIDNKTILALARESQAGGAIHFVKINTDTLTITEQGDDDIHADSLLWEKNGSYYAMISSGGNLYIGRFDNNLTLQAQSSIAIHPYAGINFQGLLILTQRDDGRVLLLDPVDLKEKQ
jgi:hypothetical protein